MDRCSYSPNHRKASLLTTSHVSKSNKIIFFCRKSISFDKSIFQNQNSDLKGIQIFESISTFVQTISLIFYSKPQRKTFIMKIIEGLKEKKEFVNILHFSAEYDLFVFIFRGKLIHIKYLNEKTLNFFI